MFQLVEAIRQRRRYTSLRDTSSRLAPDRERANVIEEFTVEDLQYLYVVVPSDEAEGTENLTAAEMSDKQFREWIVGKSEWHGIQVLPTFGKLELETRVKMGR